MIVYLGRHSATALQAELGQTLAADALGDGSLLGLLNGVRSLGQNKLDVGRVGLVRCMIQGEQTIRIHCKKGLTQQRAGEIRHTIPGRGNCHHTHR